MPAQSQQQQKLFGLALAFKRGEVPASEVSDEIKDIADRMSEKEIEDFASTKHKGLPKMKEQLRKIVREIMREKVISEISEGKKRFRQQDGVGKAKYTISYHDGKQKHKDGSDFFGIQIFKNKKDLETFRNALLKKGYIEESVNEARTVSKPIKVDDDTMVQIVGDNKGFRELTAALNPKTGKPIQKFGYERGNEIADSKEELIKKLQKKYGKSIKFESVNERLTNSDVKRMEGLHSYKKMDEALKSLVFIGKELYEEGFEKPEITEFILKKVQRRLFLQLKESVKEVHLREGMKKWKVDFKHTDGRKRTVDIEAFDKKRAEGRFKVNWGNDMKILKIYPATKNEELTKAQEKLPPALKKAIEKKEKNESVNEGYSTEEKRIVMMAVRKIAKYMNVDLETAMNYVLGAGQELERDIKKGKIKK